MKNIKTYISLIPVIAGLVLLSFASCQKDSNGSPEMKTGTPVLGEVTPAEASGGNVVTVTGTGLGNIVSIVFSKDSIPTTINPVLNTETSLLFRIPDTAIGGPQNIILTNADGKTLLVPFKVIALPIINTVWPTDFQAGTTVTITGNNFEETTKVIVDGTDEEAVIVSKSKKVLVISMPASSVNTGFLKITNTSGSSLSTIEMINVDKAVQVFTDVLKNGFESWSWGGTFEPSSDYVICGTSSMKAAFDPAGTWGGLQLGNGGSIDITGCKTFSFWVRGAEEEKKIQFWINWADQKTDLVIPANTWVHFTYDLEKDFPGAFGSKSVNNVTFQIVDAGKTLYFDNIVFIK